MKQPNILVFFSDQQRWDTCGCYGQTLPVTPHLDRMAEEGVRFENAFSCQPVCGPARASLQTGLYPTEIGCHTNHRRLPPDVTTIADRMAAQGYWTGYIGKWHLASCGPPEGEDDFRIKPVPVDRRGGFRDFWIASDVLEFTSHGYDGYMFDAEGNRREFPPGRYRADAQTDWVIEALEQIPDDRPFYLFVSFIEPHHQNDRKHYEGPVGSKDKWRSFTVPGDLEGTGGNWREEYPDYLGCCSSLDENLGRIRDVLKRRGMADDTVVVYTSDHGSHFKTRNGEYKRSCHDGCIRIPMVVCGPGFEGGKVVQDLVSLIDLPATVLAAGGADGLDEMRGRPLQPLAEGSAAEWPEEVFLQISESQCGRAIRTSEWKYSVRAPEKGGNDPDSEVYVEDFLYHLPVDPHERTNLVADPEYDTVRAELARTLVRRMVAAGEAAPRILPAGV